MSHPQGIPDQRFGVRELDREMVELLVLVPADEAAALERAAQQRDLTAGQLIRRLIRDFLDPALPPRRE